MAKKHFIIGFIIFFFLIQSTASADTMAGTYKAGDELHFKYPEGGPTVSLPGVEPKFVRWTVYDQNGNVYYETDHELTFKKNMGLYWMWYDEYSFCIPGFVAPGAWEMKGTLFNTMLVVVQLPELFPYEKQFIVEESGFVENLFAPCYFTYDAGALAGRISISLPVHLYLIAIIIGLIALIILIIKIIISHAIPVK